MKRLAIASATVGLLVACRKDPNAGAPAEPSTAPSAAPAPADHLAKGELVESKEKLFALALPRDLKPAYAFPDVAVARGEVEPELVANYVRARVSGGKVTIGASQTVFDNVRVTGAAPPRDLRIKIEKVRGVCQMELRDVTPLPPEPDPGNDADRWKKAGFAPNGKPLDPMHMK